MDSFRPTFLALPAHTLAMISRQRFHPGFSMVEAIVALVIMSVAGAALLVQFGEHTQFAVDSVDQTIAEGMALQLMDEIAGCKYVSDGQAYNSTTFGPTAWELAGAGRERYDDIDDYHNYSASPPLDRYGVTIGGEDILGRARHVKFKSPAMFTNWRQSVTVHYVADANPSSRLATGQASNLRQVEVTISYDDPVQGTVELARLRRVFSYVPAL